MTLLYLRDHEAGPLCRTQGTVVVSLLLLVLFSGLQSAGGSTDGAPPQRTLQEPLRPLLNAGPSWEAARAAARAAHLRNLELAGLLLQPNQAQPPLQAASSDRGCVASTRGAPGKAIERTSHSSGVCAGKLVGEASAAATDSLAILVSRAPEPRSSAGAAQHAALPPPWKQQQQRLSAANNSSSGGLHRDSASSPHARQAFPLPIQALLLLTHAACVVLGWRLSGRVLMGTAADTRVASASVTPASGAEFLDAAAAAPAGEIIPPSCTAAGARRTGGSSSSSSNNNNSQADLWDAAAARRSAQQRLKRRRPRLLLVSSRQRMLCTAAAAQPAAQVDDGGMPGGPATPGGTPHAHAAAVRKRRRQQQQHVQQQPPLQLVITAAPEAVLAVALPVLRCEHHAVVAAAVVTAAAAAVVVASPALSHTTATCVTQGNTHGTPHTTPHHGSLHTPRCAPHVLSIDAGRCNSLQQACMHCQCC
jgi:hypothetical protein